MPNAGFLGNPNAVDNTSVITALPASGGGVVNPNQGAVFSLTPTAGETLTAAVSPAGSEATIIVTTSGTSTFTITFGTGFKSQGTLATGATSGKVFTLQFISDGTNLNEVGRTTAM